MMAKDLIEVADLLLDRPGGRPKQAVLKRAVSTAYYAVFHALAHQNVDELLGWRIPAVDYWDIVAPLYRGIEHKAARVALGDLAKRRPGAFLRISSAFAELQEERMLADYDPKPRYALTTARQLVERARGTIEDIGALSRDDRRFLAVRLIVKPR